MRVHRTSKALPTALLTLVLLGLPITMSSASAEPPALDGPYGISAEDLATMRQQEKLHPALDAIRRAQQHTPQSGFAGVAFDGPGLSLYWKGALTPAMSAALGSEPAAGHVVVKPAAHSAAELQAAGDSILKAIPDMRTSVVDSIAYSPHGSSLTVRHRPVVLTSGVSTAAALPAEAIVARAKVSVPVRYETVAGGIESLADRNDDTTPWNGGARWTSWQGNQVRHGGCTTGFGVIANGRSWVLSAAHCASMGDLARQGKYNTLMGQIHQEEWQHDLLLIDAEGWNLIFDGPPDTGNTKRVWSYGWWAKDHQVCQSGQRSGTICGLKQIQSIDRIVDCRDPDSDRDCGYTVKGLIETRKTDGTIAGRNGDSGGPVFSLDGSGVRAMGITSARGSGDPAYLYFQDWADVIRLFRAYPRTS